MRSGLKRSLSDLKNRFRAWRGNYKVGPGCTVKSSALIRVGKLGSVSIGSNCAIMEYVLFRSGGGNITLGDHVSVNPFTVLHGHGDLTIGNRVRIAAHCNIVSFNHVFADRDAPIHKQGLSRRGVVIEDDVWIGANATVLDGVRIGTGCVIGAGSVLTKSTEPYGIYAGVPARRVGERGEARSPAGRPEGERSDIEASLDDEL